MSKIRNKRRKIENEAELNNITNKAEEITSLSNICTNNSIQTNKLNYDFYNVSCETLAKSLLGKILVRKLSCGTLLKGRIVETECYLGGEDKGSHSHNGRRTVACEPMYMDPGTAYVYLTYGMYHCFNISSYGPGAAVLLRAIDPLIGIEKMHISRKTEKRKKELKIFELCNGPSKLCISFNINKTECNKLDLCTSNELWIENNEENEDFTVVTSSRIGIDSVGEEWAKKPLRFYILQNQSVSRRDKIVEQIIVDRLGVE